MADTTRLEQEDHQVERVLVGRREQGKNSSSATMIKGRDYFMDEVLKEFTDAEVVPVFMDSEAPLFLMYTSGTTGKAKGCQHRTGGYLAYVTGTANYIQDIHPEDVNGCMADIGWITGHSYIVYGPLALAATSDTWWQTENGGFLCSRKPALDPMKPGSAGPGMPGIYPILYDEDGNEVPAGSGKAGNNCIRDGTGSAKPSRIEQPLIRLNRNCRSC